MILKLITLTAIIAVAYGGTGAHFSHSAVIKHGPKNSGNYEINTSIEHYGHHHEDSNHHLEGGQLESNLKSQGHALSSQDIILHGSSQKASEAYSSLGEGSYSYESSNQESKGLSQESGYHYQAPTTKSDLTAGSHGYEQSQGHVSHGHGYSTSIVHHATEHKHGKEALLESAYHYVAPIIEVKATQSHGSDNEFYHHESKSQQSQGAELQGHGYSSSIVHHATEPKHGKEASYESGYHYVAPAIKLETTQSHGSDNGYYHHESESQQNQDADSHDHGYSSSIVHHATGHKHEKEASHESGYHYEAPIIKLESIQSHDSDNGHYHHESEAQQSQGSGHGHAYSSQSIIHHATEHKHMEAAQDSGYHYEAPIIKLESTQSHSSDDGYYHHKLESQQSQGAKSHGHGYSSSIVHHATENKHGKEASHESGYHYEAPIIEVKTTQSHGSDNGYSHHKSKSQQSQGAESHGHGYSSSIVHHITEHKHEKEASHESGYHYVAPIIKLESSQSHGSDKGYYHHESESQQSQGTESHGHGYSTSILHHAREHKLGKEASHESGYHYTSPAIKLQTTQSHGSDNGYHHESESQQNQGVESHGHGYSSSIVHHATGHKHEKEASHESGYHYKAPVIKLESIQSHDSDNGHYHHESEAQKSQGSGHGHAYSSQSIIHHATEHKHSKAVAQDSGYHYEAPIIKLESTQSHGSDDGYYHYESESQQSQGAESHGHGYSSSIVHHATENKPGKEASHESGYQYVVPTIKLENTQSHGSDNGNYHHESESQQSQGTESHGHGYSSSIVHHATEHKQEKEASHESGYHYEVPIIKLESTQSHSHNGNYHQESEAQQSQEGVSHGYAYSSQSIIHHATEHKHGKEATHVSGYHYEAPITKSVAIESDGSDSGYYHDKSKSQHSQGSESHGHGYSSSIVHHVTEHKHEKEVSHDSGYHYEAPIVKFKSTQSRGSDNGYYHHETDTHQSQGGQDNSDYLSYFKGHEFNSGSLGLKGSESNTEDYHNVKYYPYPSYDNTYTVQNKNTGDIKTQRESGGGFAVKEEYSLHKPDGAFSFVKYNSEKHSGFNALVQNSGKYQPVEQPCHH